MSEMGTVDVSSDEAGARLQPPPTESKPPEVPPQVPSVPVGDLAMVLATHIPTVRRYIASRGIGGADLEDATQECMLRVWRCRDRLTGQCNWTAYILAVARNVVREHCYSHARTRSFDALRY